MISKRKADYWSFFNYLMKLRREKVDLAIVTLPSIKAKPSVGTYLTLAVIGANNTMKVDWGFRTLSRSRMINVRLLMRVFQVGSREVVALFGGITAYIFTICVLPYVFLKCKKNGKVK
jgi:hypothetical protein